MERFWCLRCGQVIESKPCSYCGSENVHIDVQLKDGVSVKDDLEATVVKGPSLFTIETGGRSYEYPFHPGAISGEIVGTSLDDAGLNQATPPYVRGQLMRTIGSIEHFIDGHPIETTEEHSFTLNLGIVKYQYKRRTKKSLG